MSQVLPIYNNVGVFLSHAHEDRMFARRLGNAGSNGLGDHMPDIYRFIKANFPTSGYGERGCPDLRELIKEGAPTDSLSRRTQEPDNRR